MKRYTAQVQEDEQGELVIQIPQEMLDELNWETGDKLKWVDNYNGTFTLTKLPMRPRKLALVETVSVFRHRYVVEVPEGKLSWAEDTVVSEEAEEFSQKHLEETIVSSREISVEEMQNLFVRDNDYLKDWTLEKIYERGITQIDDNGNIINKVK